MGVSITCSELCGLDFLIGYFYNTDNQPKMIAPFNTTALMSQHLPSEASCVEQVQRRFAAEGDRGTGTCERQEGKAAFLPG